MQMTDAQRRTFEFRECLGRGGFGEVYLARMTVPSGLSSTVAVKVLHAGLDPRSQGVRRLMDEGRILSMLNHPGIVGVHDLAIIEGRVALVTEFIEGADLGDCMEGDDPIPTGALYEAFAIVADALQAAHEARDSDGTPLGLLHRDVKPGNIRVGKHGQVKLLDFGIATATGMAREAQTGTNALIGSFAYMPPERFRRVPMEPSGDFYSLGCALFECIAGHRLFHLDDMAALLGPKTDPKTAAAFYAERFVLIEGISDQARDLLERMVDVRPEVRPTGPEIVAELEDLASDSGGPRLARWARAHDWSDRSPEGGGSLTGQVVVEMMGTEEVAKEPKPIEAIPDPAGATMNLQSAAQSESDSDSEPESDEAASLTEARPLDPRTATWDPSIEEAEFDDEVTTGQRRKAPLWLLAPLLGLAAVAAVGGGLSLGVAWLSVMGSDEEPTAELEPNGPGQPADPDPPPPVAASPDPTQPEPGQADPSQPGAEPSEPGRADPKQVDPTQPVPPRPEPVQPHPGSPEPEGSDGSAMVEGEGLDRCGSLSLLETKAALGALGSAGACLSRGMRASSLSQTDREKFGRLVIVDAIARCDKGDCSTYEREQPYFFEEITRSDADMMFAWARHLAKQGRHSDAGLWAARALERKQQWHGATYVKRVDALLGVKAHSAYALWQADNRNDTLRNQARADAAAWANYRGQVGKPTDQPMNLCVSAAGSEETCKKLVNDAVAKGRVVFISNPAGLALSVDGDSRGSTPIEVELSFGEHQIEIAGQGSSKHTVEVGTSQPKRWTYTVDEGRWNSAF